MKEMVLYYNPAPAPYVTKLKGVLVRMGIRIKNISREQINQKIGYLAGLPGFTETEEDTIEEESEVKELLIPEEVLVMKNFTGSRMDEFLRNLKKAGVPKIALKAVVTEQNSQWTFYRLYEEIKSEHAAMNGGPEK